MTIVHVIISRDQGLIGCTFDPVKAEMARSEQEEKEEYEGGRPSVYIEQTILIE